MASVEKVDLSSHVLDIQRDLSVQARALSKPGPPEQVDGMTVGLVTMSGQSPHGGERHRDGDKILLVVAGTVRLLYDSGTAPLELSAGSACIVRKGEWHQIECDAEAQFVHITPGPRHDVRFETRFQSFR